MAEKKSNLKVILVVAAVVIGFIVVMVAPTIEITAYHNGQVVMQSAYKLILPGSQSLINIPTDQPVDKVDVKIIQSKKTDYYLCEGVSPPTTLPEIKKECSYMGEEGG